MVSTYQNLRRKFDEAFSLYPFGKFSASLLTKSVMPAITSTFRSNEPSLSEVLRKIHDGVIQLPDFQRGWVWDEDHIRSLLASISLSYPVGAIMQFETGGEVDRFQNSHND
jgi:uncharacterized protein with ParB-like and HNH nuclease domain